MIAACTPAMTRGLEIDASADDLMASAVACTEATIFLTPILAERIHTPGQDFISDYSPCHPP